MSRWELWCAHVVLIGITAACAQGAKATAPADSTGDAPLRGSVVQTELADVIVHLVDTESNQRVETTRRIYRVAQASDALLATAGDREPLILHLETGRTHALRAEAQGFYSFEPSSSVRLATGVARHEVTFVVQAYQEPSATVALNVQTAGGLPVEGVRVELRAIGDATRYTYGATTNPGHKVQIDVPADRYWCRVSSPDGSAPWPTRLFELNLAGGDAHVQDVVADSGGTVRVRLPRDHRKLHLQLSVRPVPDNRTYAKYESRGVPEEWRGEFRVVNDSVRTATLAPGTYTIGVTANPGRKRWTRDATVKAGETVQLDFTAELQRYLDQLREELRDPAR